MNNSCENCKLNIFDLHRKGVISDILLQEILAGQSNVKYEYYKNIQVTPHALTLISNIPKFLFPSITYP